MTLRRASSSLLVALFLGALLAPNLSHADPSDADKAQARELVGEGLKALRANDFDGAFRAFSGADKLYHAPTTLLGLARAEVGLKRLVAAQEAYNKLIREPLAPNAPEIFVKAVEDATKELAALTPRIPFVLIQVKGPKDPQVTIDGGSSGALGFKRQVDPGKHVIKASAPGYLPATAEVTTVENNATPVPVTLTLTPGGPPAVASGAPSASAPVPASAAPVTSAAPAPLPPPVEPSPDSSWKTYAYIGWGVGGAGLVLGAITGALAIGKKSDLDTVCQNGHCPPDSSSTHDSYKTMGLLSTIGFATMLVGGGVGTALFFTAPATPQTGVSIRPAVGLGSVGFQGAFLWFPLVFSRISCCSRPVA